MDSRIIIKGLVDSLDGLNDSRTTKYWTDQALSLLTTEPEPCEDARKVAKEIRQLTTGKYVDDMYTPEDEKGGVMVSSYASQVSDKRAEELREHVETPRDAIERIKRNTLNANMIQISDEALAATEPKPSTKVAHVDPRIVAPDELPEPGME